MSKELLDGVNDLLTRVGVLDTNGKLTSLTDESKQVYIDLGVQLWNEVIDQLYSKSDEPRPNVLSEATITLKTGQRAYRLRDDLVRLLFPLLNETDGDYIVEYPSGYMGLVNDQPQPANYTGQPLAAAIRPTDGKLYLDFIPTANENGEVYKYRYYKDTVLTDAADCFPFTDAVYRGLLPAASELWNLYRKGGESFNSSVFRISMGRASRFLRTKSQRDSWGPKRVQVNATDPMNG